MIPAAIMEGLTTSTLFACSAARLFLLANILTGSQTAWRVCKVKAMATSKLQKERRVLQAPEATAGGLASDHSDDERQSQPLESQNPEKRRKRWPLLSGWWWETGSLVLCIISMALSATVFLCMADKPLRTWRLPIQPNSLIAVFSTITKAALLFPLSECIGQLKWGFFRQPRRLSDMHAFDIASRGPWGATVFLWETNAIASPLASVGAAVTILLLAFEPFMQQVIVFESRIAPLHNITTAAVSTTKSWPNGEDGPFGGVAPIENLDIPITSSILSAVSHSDDLPYDLNIYCPTLGCNYSAFETLAICSSCETEEVQISDFGCKIELAWSNCTECDALQPSLAFSSWDEARENIRENIYKSCFFDLNATCIYEKTKDSDDPLSLTLSVHKGMILGEDQSCNGRLESAQFELLQTVTQPGDVGIEETSFMQHTVGFWDDNTTETMIISSSSDAFLKEKYLSFCNSLYPNYHEWKDHETAILVSNCFTSTTDLETWKENTIESIEKLGSITGRVTTCTLKFCAKKYDNVRVGDHQSWGEDGQSLPLSSRPTERYPMEEDMRRFCVDGDPSCPYSWSRDSRRELLRSIAAGLGSYQFALALNLPISGPSTPDKFSRLFDRIAKGASKVLQSPLNPAATNVTGIAEGPEIFVKVRWEWFAFPVFVALVGVVFLLATVVRSRGEARLFKNSILAAFLFELEGWAAEGRRVDGRDGRQTGEDVLRVSQGIVGSIRTDDTVDLKFKRE